MSLRYLLDTNICIYIAKRKPEKALHKLSEKKIGEVAMSVITYGELLFGAEKSQQRVNAMQIIEELITFIPPIDLNDNAALHYGKIRASLEKNGKPIGNNDLWIAAHALSLNTILVTNNTNEFSRVHHLKLENWT